jgi:hypothetical protein
LNLDLPDLSLQIAGIIGMSQQQLASFFSSLKKEYFRIGSSSISDLA